jgi:hypothetical protein
MGDALDDLLEAAQKPALEEGDNGFPIEGMGVKFLNISDVEKQVLRDFLQKETY